MGWNSLFGGEKSQSALHWKPLTNIAQLDQLLRESALRPQLIFKHSTRCNISSMALSRLEKDWNLQDGVDAWYLDLLAYRTISNTIADRLKVAHESPQAILLMDGKVKQVSAHSGISVRALTEAIG